MDLVESVRLMAANEKDVIQRWRAFMHRATTEVLPAYDGRFVKGLGDGLMAEFDAAPQAVGAALTLHRLLESDNAAWPPQSQMQLRGGANAGQIYVDTTDIYGSDVNLAARVMTLAGPGETVVTANVRDGLTDGLDADVEDLGECYLKHIEQPVRAYRVGPAGPRPVVPAQRAYAASLLPTIAVIPFEARNNAPEHFAIGELIADGVIAPLSRTREIKVVSRLSTTAFRGRSSDVGEVQAHLGANYVLSGSYLATGTKLLVSTTLVDVRTSEVMCSDRVSADLADLLQPQSELCHSIADSCHRAVLDREVQSALVKPLPTLASYSLLVAGISGIHQASAHNFETSGKALSEIIERHPRHVESYAWLAKWHAIRANRRLAIDADADREAASVLMTKAMNLAPDDAFGLTITGLVKSFFQQDLESAEACYTRALQFNPNEPLAWLYMGTLRSWQGRGAEAAQAATRALELAPLGTMRSYFDSLAALPMLSAGNYGRAIALCRSALRSNSGHTATYRVLAMALVMDAQVDEARKVVARLMQIEPNFSVARFQARYAGRAHPHALVFSEALRVAGVPST